MNNVRNYNYPWTVFVLMYFLILNSGRARSSWNSAVVDRDGSRHVHRESSRRDTERCGTEIRQACSTENAGSWWWGEYVTLTDLKFAHNLYSKSETFEILAKIWSREEFSKLYSSNEDHDSCDLISHGFLMRTLLGLSGFLEASLSNYFIFFFRK